MNQKIKSLILLTIILGALTLFIQFIVAPSIQIFLETDEKAAEKDITILHYFGNLTVAECNSEGQIIKLKFEDGSAFKLDHYEYIGSAGFNKYYNVTYQEPDQLISIQEYVEGAAFK